MLEIGSLVDGKYRILREVGRGGMSVVYMAIVEKANKTWAVKEVRKDGQSNDFEIVKQGLIAETDILKRLNHPYLPSIIDVIDRDDSFLIVMDYVEGISLGKRLAEFGAQPQKEVIKWAKQLCDVLGYLHSRKPPIIYRDLKPSNIMLKPDGNITLIDFGTAREYKEKNLEDTTCLGTIGYAAPEQFGGQGQTDARTDIYNLGATLYHLVTNHNPSEPPYMIQPIRQINPQLSPGLEMIIAKCTQPDPNRRYQNAEELMYALDNYENIDVRHKTKMKQRVIVFGTSCLLTIGLAVGSVFAYQAAEGRKGDLYQNYLASGQNAAKPKEERIDNFLKAIATDPAQKEAYLEMTKMFLALDENNGLTKEEASVFTQLEAGLNVESGKGAGQALFPLQVLKEQNPDGYAEVCYEIGNAYWYDYTVGSDRETKAAVWFDRCIDKYPIADIYGKIGRTKQEIRRYREQNRTEKMYTSYGDLWGIQKDMFETAEKMNDNDTRLLVWPELISTISAETQYFLQVVEAQEIQDLLDKIKAANEEIAKNNQLPEIQKMVDEVNERLVQAQSRFDSAVAEKGKAEA